MSAWPEAVWLAKKIDQAVAKKSVIMTTNSGTSTNPIPAEVSNDQVAEGALFFIQS